MPSWRLHKFADEVFFGKSYSRIHRKMDAPVIYLGRTHRVLFHDPVTASIIAQKCYPNDPKAVAAANLHIFLDNLCSIDPAVKKFLEQMEISQRRRKTSRKRKRKAPEDPLTNFITKLEEAKKFLSPSSISKAKEQPQKTCHKYLSRTDAARNLLPRMATNAK